MHIKTIPVGQLQTNCYVVTDPDTKACIIIDPGDESPVIQRYLEDFGLTPQAIFITHGHYDHTMATDDLVRAWGIPVYIGAADVSTDSRPHPYRYAASGDTRYWEDGEEATIGGLTFRIIATPGHSPGGVCILGDGCLFTGDTLFRDDCGRMDLPGGCAHTMMQSLAKIDALEGDLEIYPGHAEATSLGRERRFNHYLRQAATGKSWS
ncbi:MAG: MBL fold metallo-hydrolase [Oscillospiraceae bacterium]|nr:MBL fold metallo-hydrolase [Oscillospiraceae bacterium]